MMRVQNKDYGRRGGAEVNFELQDQGLDQEARVCLSDASFCPSSSRSPKKEPIFV